MKLEAMSGLDSSSSTRASRGGLVVAVAVIVGGFLAFQVDPVDISGEVDTTAVGGRVVGTDVASGSTSVEGTDSTAPGVSTSTGVTDSTDSASSTNSVDSTNSSEPSDPTSSTTPVETTTPTTSAETTTAVSGVRDPSQVTIAVLNGSTVDGAAGKASDRAVAAGYFVLPAANAQGLKDSGIYYMEGYENEANALADGLGEGLRVVVKPYDPANPLAEEDEPTGANLIIVLGDDGLIPLS